MRKIKRVDGSELVIDNIIDEHFDSKNNYADWLLNQINGGLYSQFFQEKEGKLKVLDIGANCGIFSCYVYPMCSTLVCVEPMPAHFKNLTRFSKLFPNAYLVNSAVSDVNGSVELFLCPENTAMTSIKSIASREQQSGSINVTSRTLSDLIDEFGSFDFVKIDVEGAEDVIVNSMTKSDYDNITQLYIEFHPDSFKVSPEPLINKLKSLGYNVITWHDIILASK